MSNSNLFIADIKFSITTSFSNLLVLYLRFCLLAGFFSRSSASHFSFVILKNLQGYFCSSPSITTNLTFISNLNSVFFFVYGMIRNFQDPPLPLSIYVQNHSNTLTWDIQPQTALIRYQVLHSGQLSFLCINSLILSGFPLACFYLAEASQKNTSHSNWPHVMLLDLGHKQCNGIIKGWLHCLTSESKERFLVNNLLMFGSAWSLFMAQIQFSLIKKDWTSTALANLPTPLIPITFHFCLNPQAHLKVDVICVPLLSIVWLFICFSAALLSFAKKTFCIINEVLCSPSLIKKFSVPLNFYSLHKVLFFLLLFLISLHHHFCIFPVYRVPPKVNYFKRTYGEFLKPYKFDEFSLIFEMDRALHNYTPFHH